MLLSELKKNEAAIIKKINLDYKTKTRLFAIGLVNGAIIEFIRIAPLGDTLEYLVSGNFIIIRKNLASKIEIEEIRNEKSGIRWQS